MSLIALGIGTAVSLGASAIQGQINKKRQEEEERKRKEYETKVATQELVAQGDQIAAQNLNQYNPMEYEMEDKVLYAPGGVHVSNPYYDYDKTMGLGINNKSLDYSLNQGAKGFNTDTGVTVNTNPTAPVASKIGGDLAGGLVGAGIGAASSIGSMLINNLNYEAPDLGNPEDDARYKNATSRSSAARDLMRAKSNPQFFSTGGLRKTSNNTFAVDAGTHESGNDVKIGSGANEAYVEGDEVIKQDQGIDKIYSDRIKVPGTNKSFGEVAEEISISKGEVDERKNDNDLIVKQTANRNSDKLDMKMDKLFDFQENIKKIVGKSTNGEVFANGGERETGRTGMPDYNTRFPQKTKSGNQYYITRATIETINDPNTKPFADGYMYYTDESLVSKHGNIQPAYGDFDKGEINYHTDLEGDPSKFQKAMDGVLADEELEYIPSDTSRVKYDNGGLRTWYEQDPKKATNIIGTGLNLTDNIVNAMLTSQMDDDANKVDLSSNKIKPNLIKAQKLETEYDINPQRQQLARDVQSFDKMIEDEVSSNAQRLANKQQVVSKKIDAENQLFDTKNKTEIQLRNQNKLNKQGVDQFNVQSKNAADRINAQFGVQEQSINSQIGAQNEELKRSRISANVANLVEDAKAFVSETQSQVTDKELFVALEDSYNNTGVASKNLSSGAYSRLSSNQIEQIVNNMIVGGNYQYNDYVKDLDSHNNQVTGNKRVTPMSETEFNKLRGKGKMNKRNSDNSQGTGKLSIPDLLNTVGIAGNDSQSSAK